MVKHSLWVFFLSLLSWMPFAVLADFDCPSFREVQGEYKAVEVTRYGGGLTPREEAIGRINKKVIVAESHFLFWDELRYEDPIYEVVCHPVPQEEGEVPLPTERWGNFYGFGMDREVVKIIHITPSKGEGPGLRLEIVDDELWFFSDGWFYRMRRVSNQ